MIEITDQTGEKISLSAVPQRIISLVPSQTELLHTLALDDKVIGITKFCVHPDYWRKEKKVVGGTKILRFKTIKELKPDLIIANKEENNRQDIERLRKQCPVYVSDVKHLEDALQMIKDIGILTGTQAAAVQLTDAIVEKFNHLETINGPRTLYLIWKKPYMAAGKGTFIDDILSKTGFVNVIEKERYPNLKIIDIEQLNPELVLFSSEPYPFKEHHMKEIETILPHAKMQLVDGEPFSWYGSRLLYSVDYLNKLVKVLQG